MQVFPGSPQYCQPFQSKTPQGSLGRTGAHAIPVDEAAHAETLMEFADLRKDGIKLKDVKNNGKVVESLRVFNTIPKL